MKKWNSFVFALFISSVVAGGFAASPAAEAMELSPEFSVDDQSFHSHAETRNGVFLMPLTTIHRLTKAKVSWNNVHKKAVVRLNDKKYVITADRSTVLTNAKSIQLKTSAEIINGRIFVPATFLADISDATFEQSDDHISTKFKTNNYYKMTLAGNPDTIITPMKVEDYDYVKGMKLQFEGKTYSFPEWEGLWNWRYKPQMIAEDLSGDGTKDIVVVNTLGYGTGLLQQEAKVWNPVTKKEEKIDSLEHIISEKVNSTITPGKDQIVITLQIEGKKQPIKQVIKEDIDEQYLFEKLGFGAVEQYEIKDGKLMMRAGATYWNTIFAGELVVTYQYKDHSYQAETIEYEPYDN